MSVSVAFWLQALPFGHIVAPNALARRSVNGESEAAGELVVRHRWPKRKGG